ncbi:unnamed protein product [Mortierella alpina]
MILTALIIVGMSMSNISGTPCGVCLSASTTATAILTTLLRSRTHKTFENKNGRLNDNAMQPTVPTKRSADVDFFEQLDRVVESMAEEDAGRVPRCLETGPRLEVRAFGKKRRIQRDSSPSPEIALVSPSPSFASFPSSNSLDKTRQHNPRNDSRPATHYTRIASRPATHSSRNASRPTPYNSRNASRPSTRSQTGVVPSSVHSDPFLSTPSNVPSETSPPKLVDHETLTTIAESHSVHISPRGSSACARTLPQSLSPTMGSRTSPQQEKPPQHETPLQQEKAPQQEIPLEQEIVTEAVPTVAKQKKPYSRKRSQ